MKSKRAVRNRPSPLQIMLTLEERVRFDELRDARGVTMRELVVSAVLGGPPTLVERVAQLEAEVSKLRSGE